MVKKVICAVLLLWVGMPSVSAQGITDPTRASLYVTLTKTAGAVVEAQNRIILLNTQGHRWNAQALKKENKFLTEYQKYLVSFGNVLTIAANIYGIYYETSRCAKLVGESGKVVSHSPKNVIAVALSPVRHKIYNEVMEQGIKVLADLELVLPKHIKKATTGANGVATGDSTTVWNYADIGDRIDALNTIRKDLRTMNRLLYSCNHLIRYTTLLDTWYEFLDSSPIHKTKSIGELSKECEKRWSEHLKSQK
uniref:hypothetical protein n=1 Tax=Prevotella sp. TaxID=59823 RepID=UPI0040295326